MRERIAAARVGGTFWGAPVRSEARIVVRAGDAAAGTTIAAALGIGRAMDVLAIGPVGRADPAGLFAAAGIPVLAGTFDPWSLLGPGRTLVAPADDEWVLVAHLAGAAVLGIDPAELDRRLANALAAATYRDCFTGAPVSIDRAIETLAEWRRAAGRTAGIVAAAGVAWWKKPACGRMLWLGEAALPAFHDTAPLAIKAAARAAGGIAVWPSRAPAGLVAGAAAADVPLARIEDGFIRSVGLGSGLHPPSSIVLDRRGIYFDPAIPSDLEHLLQTEGIPPSLVARAARLRDAIVAGGIGKYASVAIAEPPPRTPGERVVLVAGQVEDDLSVRSGGGGVAGNLDLLRRARAHEPDARILFKPHPDVDAGHRVGGVPDAEMLAFADEIVRGEAMPALLARVDAVHVLTSLTGFEALLRGLEVIVHGQPFYAGWGLTRDLAGPIARRTRRRTLDELVAATLILYPLYLDPETQLPCPPEVLLGRFAARRRPRLTAVTLLRAAQGRLAKLLGTTTA